jgi:hypothetical protein
MPGQPKRFVAIGIAIAAMALNTFNAYRITELNNEISALKSKPDLLTSITWRKSPMRRINYWLTSLNPTSGLPQKSPTL